MTSEKKCGFTKGISQMSLMGVFYVGTLSLGHVVKPQSCRSNRKHIMYPDKSANWNVHFKITGFKKKKKVYPLFECKIASCHSGQQEIKLPNMQTSWREITNQHSQHSTCPESVSSEAKLSSKDGQNKTFSINPALIRFGCSEN